MQQYTSLTTLGCRYGVRCGYSSDTPPYLYSGNELDKLNGLNQYDFHARWLDNAVPRFTTQDPLAEAHYDESPYVYCGNDPVNRVDPLELDWYYNDRNEFPTYIEGSKDDKRYKWHSKTAFRESDHYRYFFGEGGSIAIVEKTTGDAMNYLPETVVNRNSSYVNYNVGYSYMDMMNAKAQWEGQEDGSDIDSKTMDNVRYFANGVVTAFNAAGDMAKYDLIKSYKAGGNVTHIVKDWQAINKTLKPFSIAGKVLGVTSLISHTGKFIDAYRSGDTMSMVINGGKVAADVTFMFAKTVNPVVLGASVVYGVIDYMTNDY